MLVHRAETPQGAQSERTVWTDEVGTHTAHTPIHTHTHTPLHTHTYTHPHPPLRAMELRRMFVKRDRFSERIYAYTHDGLDIDYTSKG